MGDAYAAFERDVPEHLREDAMQCMAEATAGCGEPPNVYILDRDRLDAINCRAHGIITIEGAEFTFQMDDGNRNGTVLREWESDKPFEHHVPVSWALQPSRALIDEAVMASKGPFLIWKWDAMLANRKAIAEIPGKYAYDKHFAPGGKTESFWRDQAAKHHFEIVSQETADETRAMLAQQVHP